ncbi:MAG: hypothetical protein MESAZ_02479 [Saezia sanguinis]
MNEIHNNFSLNFADIQNEVNLTWKDILWGYEKNY